MTVVLAAGYRSRPPRRDEAEAVAAVVIATDIAEYGVADFSVEALHDEWRELDLTRDAWVVVAPDGQIVGYGSVWERGQVRIEADIYVHPLHTGLGIGRHLVRLSEVRAREHFPLAPPEARVVLHNTVNASNQAARDLLTAEGYAPVRHFWRMMIDLSESPPAPDWPVGITVQTCGPDADERVFYETVQEAMLDHWAHVPVPFEAWTQRLKGDRFDPSLWFLEREADEPVGAALCGYHLEYGFIHSLVVRRPWRQRGLGRALLQHAFGEFYRRGTHEVSLNVDAESPTGAISLYAGVGMRIAYQYATYQKELRPGVDSFDRT